MATENKGVMVYLPKEVEEYITEFCTEYNITRKDKEGNTLPSLGTGIVTYLKSKMSGESPSDVLAKPKSLVNGLNKDEVLDLIREYGTSDAPSNGLSREEVLDLIGESNIPTGETLAQLKGEIAEVSEFARNLQGEIAALKRANKPTETAAPKPNKTTEPKESIEDESKDVQRAYRLLTDLDGLKNAFIAAVEAHGKSSQAIADDLFSQNQAWGRTDSKTGERAAHSPETISRMRKALTYIQSGEGQ